LLGLVLAACSQADPGPATMLSGGRLIVPAEVAAGHRYPVLFVTDDPTASGSVTVGDQRMNVYRGRGAGTLIARATAGALTLVAPGPTFGAQVTLTVSDRPIITIDADLAAAHWDASHDVVITRDVTIGSLTIDAGTRVRLAAGADLHIGSSIIASGSDGAPVLFTPEATTWSGLHLAVGATATFTDTWFIGGGDDATQVFGHSSSQPVIAADGGTIIMTGGGVLDSPGKAFGVTATTVSLSGTTVAHCDSGGEFAASLVNVDHAYVLEIPDGDRNIRDDDNDGIYLQGTTPGQSSITHSVFAVGEDDAIDHNGATVRIEHTWIEGYSHEGVAASSGGMVTMADDVIRDCEVGIEAGYGSPQVVVGTTLVSGCAIGVRFGDEYQEACTGRLAITDSIISGNHDDVVNFVPVLGGPSPGSIEIDCSYVDDPEATGTDDLATAPPLDGVCLAAGTAWPAACDGRAGPVSCPAGPP
jgi:hypothetical protein